MFTSALTRRVIIPALIVFSLLSGMSGLASGVGTLILIRDLHLNYQDLGHITGALSVAWGVSALFMGNLASAYFRRHGHEFGHL